MQQLPLLELEGEKELEARWGELLGDAERRLGREAVESWLRDLRPLQLDSERIILAAPNATSRTWVEKRYVKSLATIGSELWGGTPTIEVVVRKSNRATERSTSPSTTPAAPAQSRPPCSPHFAPIPLNPAYTFENYVVGQSNRFAHAAASAVAGRPGREFNPLFVYGGVGLGKTHLLHAIGLALQAKDPRCRVAYVSGETFTSHFVTSLRERQEAEFRRSYRNVDIWLVDDIQFIADKAGTKEEFFHTFNELYLTNRQIVLASDKPPKELHLMEERLRSRLESGLMVEIGVPDLETRVAIIQMRAEAEGMELPPDIVYQIARTVTANIRALEAAVIRLMALASLNRCDVTPDLVASALGAFVQEGRFVAINELVIQKAVCEHFGVTEDELTGPKRDRRIALARQIAMYLTRELSKKSLAEIGQLFGGKTHTTVMYSCDAAEAAMKQNAELKVAVRELRGQLAQQVSTG